MGDLYGGIEIYESQDGSVVLDVHTDGQTVWLSLDQLAVLFGRDKSTISRHISHVFSEGEANRDAVVADFATTAADGKIYQVTYFNLDVVISVGYRVKSAEGVAFRRWATDVLRRYLVDGAAINARRLEQIGKLVQILERATDAVVAGTAEVLQQYLPGLRLLERYDDKALAVAPGDAPSWQLTYREAREIVDALAGEFPENTLFGRERGEALQSVVAGIYQSFGGQDLYPSVQLKAANLLYLTVKDHPLTDGNKRTAATLFVHFLAQNGALRDAGGELLISNNALAAVTLMVALSDPREKDLMCALITTMLAGSAT